MSDLPAPPRMDAPFLKIENITVRRNRTNVLKDVNLTIHRGEFVGMVGPNGGENRRLCKPSLDCSSVSPVVYPFLAKHHCQRACSGK